MLHDGKPGAIRAFLASNRLWEEKEIRLAAAAE
jgi:hypothetical protein